MRRALILSILLLALAAQVWAAAAPVNMAAPWKNVLVVQKGQSVQAAITKAVAKGASASNPYTVKIEPGTYTPAAFTLPAGVSLIGADRDRCIINAQGVVSEGYAIYVSSNTSIRNLTVNNTRLNGTNSCLRSVVGGADNVEIVNCKLTCSQWGVYMNLGSSNVTVRDCYIEACNDFYVFGSDHKIVGNIGRYSGPDYDACFAALDASGMTTGLIFRDNDIKKTLTHMSSSSVLAYFAALNGGDHVFQGNSIDIVLNSDNGAGTSVNDLIYTSGSGGSTLPIVIADNRFTYRNYETDDTGTWGVIGSGTIDQPFASACPNFEFANNAFDIVTASTPTIYRFRMTDAGATPLLGTPTFNVFRGGLRGLETYPDVLSTATLQSKDMVAQTVTLKPTVASTNVNSPGVDLPAEPDGGHAIADYTTVAAGAWAVHATKATPDTPRNVCIAIKNDTGGALNLNAAAMTFTVTGTHRGRTVREKIPFDAWVEAGDTNNQLSDWNIPGVVDTLYWDVTRTGSGPYTYTVTVYTDTDKTAPVLRGSTQTLGDYILLYQYPDSWSFVSGYTYSYVKLATSWTADDVHSGGAQNTLTMDMSIAAAQWRMKYGRQPFDSISAVTLDAVPDNGLKIAVGVGSRIGICGPLARRSVSDVILATQNGTAITLAGNVDVYDTVNFGTVTATQPLEVTYYGL